jgi:hypothetical protein
MVRGQIQPSPCCQVEGVPARIRSPNDGSAGPARESSPSTVAGGDGSAPRGHAGHLATTGALASHPTVRQRDAAAGDVAARDVTPVKTGDVASARTAAADRAIVAAGKGAARSIMAGKRAVIDAPPSAARGARAVDAATRLATNEVTGIEIAAHTRSVRAVVVPAPAIAAGREKDKAGARENERNPVPHATNL